MFHVIDDDGQYSPTHYIAEITAMIGHPPLHYLQRSPETLNCFDEQGQSRYLLSR